MRKNLICLLITALLIASTLSIFCSSTCADYVQACYNETPQGCYACADHIYELNANMSSTTPCTTKSQITVLAKELSNTNMTLFGYTSSQYTPVTCTNYTFSGQYTNSDYIFKNFTNIPLNHYALVVRFNVGYIGTWSNTDYLRLKLEDQLQSVNYDYRYYCDYPQNICGQIGNISDCIRIREYTLTHNTSYLALTFSALTTESNPAVQYWGIKELTIAAKRCHAFCLTCFGGSNSNCLSCATGYYLQGNVCLPTCQNNLYTIFDARICVTQCPTKYYGIVNSTARSCVSCPAGCALCSSSDLCMTWQNEEAHIPNMWNDKIQFWILLIIVLVSLLVYIIYKIVQKNLPQSDLQQKMCTKSDDNKDVKQPKFDGKPVLSTETKGGQIMTLPNDSMIDSLGQAVDLKGGESLWFNELVQMEPIEVRVKGRRKRVNRTPSPKQINASNNNIDDSSNVDL